MHFFLDSKIQGEYDFEVKYIALMTEEEFHSLEKNENKE